ncbi:hypothetical protein D3C83_115390 [compost metagenome]
MLQRALREVLALGYLLQAGAALHERTGYASKAELHRQRDAHRPAADYDNLMPPVLAHVLLSCSSRSSCPYAV